MSRLTQLACLSYGVRGSPSSAVTPSVSQVVAQWHPMRMTAAVLTLRPKLTLHVLMSEVESETCYEARSHAHDGWETCCRCFPARLKMGMSATPRQRQQ